MIFESHAHYDDDRFEDDRDEIIKSLPENGIECAINVGANIESSKATLDLCNRFDHIYGAIGVHPHDAKELNDELFNWLRDNADRDKIVAIGEIGLDYFYDKSERDIQKLWFERQIILAKEKNMPIIVHSRDAAKDTIDILNSTNAWQVGGVIHCFSYAYEVAKQLVDMGFYIGIGGVITFGNAKKLKEAVEKLPMDRLLLETDCPYLAPTPHRGERNSSLYLPLVAQAIADIKGIEYEEVVSITNQNARKLFRM